MNCPSYVFICLYAAAWIVGSSMFLYRGIINVIEAKQIAETAVIYQNTTNNFSLNNTNIGDITDRNNYKGYRTGIVLIVVATFMLTMVPLCAFITLMEKRYRKKRRFRMVCYFTI
ncbi:hypothetical protein O3M35_006744 [Rhynocoris fuscipes]|uniref:Uncharacterized protein n=1 Tax=Rhynocoris fuscipes TaxID=488301 RepID=A0AAW1DJT6_9HEMI